jgi:hypothetical protein
MHAGPDIIHGRQELDQEGGGSNLLTPFFDMQLKKNTHRVWQERLQNIEQKPDHIKVIC